MKVRMLSTQRGSEDGIHIATHEAGAVLDLAERLAGIYLRAGFAVSVDVPLEVAAPAPVAAPAAPAPPEPAPVAPKKNTAQKAPQRKKASGGKKR